MFNTCTQCVTTLIYRKRQLAKLKIAPKLICSWPASSKIVIAAEDTRGCNHQFNLSVWSLFYIDWAQFNKDIFKKALVRWRLQQRTQKVISKNAYEILIIVLIGQILRATQ